MAARQVFGKGNTAFWIVFSIIHITATLLLSTQLYYMGRWKLGEGMSRAGCVGGACWAPWNEGWVASGTWTPRRLLGSGGLEESLGEDLGEALA